MDVDYLVPTYLEETSEKYKLSYKKLCKICVYWFPILQVAQAIDGKHDINYKPQELVDAVIEKYGTVTHKKKTFIPRLKVNKEHVATLKLQYKRFTVILETLKKHFYFCTNYMIPLPKELFRYILSKEEDSELVELVMEFVDSERLSFGECICRLYPKKQEYVDIMSLLLNRKPVELDLSNLKLLCPNLVEVDNTQ